MKFLFYFLLLLPLAACTPPQTEEGGSAELALIGEDIERTRIEEGEAYCGGDVGDLIMEGNYHLESHLNDQLVDTYELGAMTFVTGQPHDDLHLWVEDVDLKIYEIFQYGGCSFEMVRLFLLNPDGDIEAISFIKDGETLDYVYTDNEGKFSVDEDVFTFCPYDNLTGKMVCDSYEYKEASLYYLSTSYDDEETYQNL